MASLFPEADSIIAPSLGGKPTAAAAAAPPAFPEADKILAPSLQRREGEKDNPAGDWDGIQQALDAVVFGKYSASDPERGRAKEAWVKDHPGKALAADLAGRSVPMLAIGAAASLALPELGAAVGLGALGRFLAGTLGESTMVRLGSMATQGAWQGALGAKINNLVGAQKPENVGGSAIAGGIAGPLGGLLTYPLRSNIAPEVAEAARGYMRSGVRLTPGQVPGAPPITRGLSSILRLGNKDLPRLTGGLMRSIGEDAKTPMTAANVATRRTALQQEIQAATAKGDAAAEQLARNQDQNAQILERLANDSGVVDPRALVQEVQSQNAGNALAGQMSVEQAGVAAGNPVNVEALARGGELFARQPTGRPSLRTFRDLALGSAGLIAGFRESGLGNIMEKGVEHLPEELRLAAGVGGTALGAAYTAGGGLINNPFYLRALLSGRMPTVNPLVSPVQQLWGDASMPNTSAFAKTNALTPAQGADAGIQAGADASGLDPRYVRAIASIESDQNPFSNRYKATQYKGLFQIGKDEWNQYGSGDIYNAEDNARAFGWIAKGNADWFRSRFGRDPTPTNIYMMHLQGRGFYENGTMTNVAGNPYPGMSGPQTPASFEAGWGRELERRAAALAGIQVRAGPTSAGLTSVLQPITGAGPSQDEITNTLAGSQ